MMLPLEKLDLKLPAKPVARGKPVVMQWLPIAGLLVDDRYQRKVDKAGRAHIAQIARNFEWRKFAPVIVCASGRGDGTHAIIDGQHRTSAALVLGYEQVPCAVVEADVTDAAGIFAAVNGAVRPINIMQVYKAALAGGDDWAVSVSRACSAEGIVALTYPVQSVRQEPMMTNAVGRLRRTVERHGETMLLAVLRRVKAAPLVAVPGYINSKVIEGALREVLAAQTPGENPLRTVERLNVQVSQRQQPLAGPAHVVPVVDVTGFAKDTPELVTRVRELKARGFTRSMVAASLKARATLVDKYWEQTP